MEKNYDSNLKWTAMKFQALGIQGFKPKISQSEKWIKWVTFFSKGTCLNCARQNGKIYDKNNMNDKRPPLHEKCACVLQSLLTILAGTATIHGYEGADYSIKKYNILPKNYISKEDAMRSGWKNALGNLRKVLPNATIGGNYFFNIDGKLPSKYDRIWYEADINYKGGYRNSHRLVYSNDGLIFVTYDHYITFYEVT